MNKNAWTAFCSARDRYKQLITGMTDAVPASVIQKLVDGREGPSYTVDTPVVYNLALDEFTQESDIKMILVADNPGRREQAAENRRYLVGPSGKIAEKFFRDNPALGIDFRRNVLILNKTPIHTPRTAELKELCRLGGKTLNDAVLSSQQVMAELLAEFWEALQKNRTDGGTTGVWITGYSEMKKGGVFEAYTEKLKMICADNPDFGRRLFFYRHFSMNQFTIDLKQQARPDETLDKNLRRIGAAYRERILGH